MLHGTQGNLAEIPELCKLLTAEKVRNSTGTVCMSHRNRDRRRQKAGCMGTATTSLPSRDSQSL